MNAKITKKRLSDMLSYDWLKIVGAAAGGILIWSLIFTTTATRMRPSQRFSVFNYTSNTSFNGTKFSDRESSLFGKDVFSYEVIENGIIDLAATPDQAYTLLQTRLVTDEGNVMFIANTEDKSTEYKDNDNQVYYKTHLENFANGGYGYAMADLSMDGKYSYFKSLEEYLSRFYVDWKDEDSLNKESVKSEFLTRAEKNNDKRFKTEKEKEKGIKNDIIRIQKYRDGLEDFYSYLDSEYVSITKIDVPIENETISRYAINLCPNEDTMGSLKEIVNYQTTYEDSEGNEKKKLSVKDMHLVLFDLDGIENGFQYESLLFVNNLIELYCTALQK